METFLKVQEIYIDQAKIVSTKRDHWIIRDNDGNVMKMVYHENLLNKFYSWSIFNSIESTKRLNHHVKEKGLWDFFCYRSNTVLISCLLDGADDVSI